MPDQIPATLIPGDGIGPEITGSVRAVFTALGEPFAWEEHAAGLGAIATHGDPLPATTLANIRKTKLALKGPLTTPVGGGFKSVNVELRREFELYANLRPALTLVPGQRYDNIDLILVRENLEGYYAAFEHYLPVGDNKRLKEFKYAKREERFRAPPRPSAHSLIPFEFSPVLFGPLPSPLPFPVRTCLEMEAHGNRFA